VPPVVGRMPVHVAVRSLLCKILVPLHGKPTFCFEFQFNQ